MTAPPFAAFSALWFSYFAAIGLFSPFAPLWFSELGFSTLAIGAMASLQAWTRVIAPYGWGWLGDHRGQRMRWVQLSSAAAVLAASGLLWARGEAAVSLCVALLFLANGAVIPLSEATLARHLLTPGGMDSGRYGRVRVWGSIGFISAVLVYGAVLEALGLQWFPVLVVAMYGLMWVMSLRVPGARDEKPSTAAAPPIWPVLRQPEVAWFFGAMFFTVLAHTALYAFLSLYLVELGYSKATVGLMWAVGVLVEIVFFWAQGQFFGQFLRGQQPHRWLQWAAAASVLRFAATGAFAASPVVLVAAQCLHAVTFAGQHAACIVLINRYFEGPLRGRGQALYTTLGYGASGVIGGLAGGWLSTHFGFAAVFWAAAGAAVVGWVCAVAAQRHAPQPGTLQESGLGGR
jgi:MFS transporter, PPP family, 3-phenylpropionic acid transporter